jgi:hypothetical protein
MLNKDNTDLGYLLGRLIGCLAVAKERKPHYDYDGWAWDNDGLYLKPKLGLQKIMVKFEVELRDNPRPLHGLVGREWADIVAKLPKDIPVAPLPLNGQGLIGIGFYHQKESLYRELGQKK